MKHVLMRRQVLKIVGGMVLSPRPLLAASNPASGIQQVLAALLVATEEGSLLQIDPEDLRNALKLCGSSPMSFTVTNHDADKVLDACRDALARMPTHNKAAAVAVCSGYGKGFQLTQCAEVFRVIQHAMDESAYQVFAAVFDPALVDAMSVTCLVGAPDG